jgi:hypothetical protein
MAFKRIFSFHSIRFLPQNSHLRMIYIFAFSIKICTYLHTAADIEAKDMIRAANELLEMSAFKKLPFSRDYLR